MNKYCRRINDELMQGILASINYYGRMHENEPGLSSLSLSWCYAKGSLTANCLSTPTSRTETGLGMGDGSKAHI